MKKTKAIVKSLSLCRLITFLVFVLNLDESTASEIERSSTENLSDRSIFESRHICLEPPNNLPICDFVNEDGDNIEDSSINTQTLRRVRSFDQLEDSSSRKDHGSKPIVFKIERCIPPGFLLKFPLCDSETLIASKGEHGSFLPYNIIGNPNQNDEAPMEFPKFHMDDWQRNINIHWNRLIKDDDDVEQRNSKVPEDSASRSTVTKQPTVIRLKRETKDKPENNVFSTFSSSSSAEDREIEINDEALKKSMGNHVERTNDNLSMNSHEEGKTSDELVSHDSKEALKKQFDSNTRGLNNGDERKSENFRQFLLNPRKLSTNKDDVYLSTIPYEFPYHLAIDYDPLKLREMKKYEDESEIQKKSSEFPSRTAVPFDPSEHEDPRAMKRPSMLSTIPYEFPYHLAIDYDPLKLRDTNKNENELEITKKWRESSYRTAVPFDPSKLRHPRSTNEESSLSTVPYEFPYHLAIPYDPLKLREMKKYENESEIQKKSSGSSYRTAVPFDPLVHEDPRATNLPKLSSTIPFEFPYHLAIDYDPLKLRDTNKNENELEIPKKWRESSYRTAVPFDPSKLRHPRSTNEESSLSTIPYEFPYHLAIPYDPLKLREMKKYENESEIQKKSSGSPYRTAVPFDSLSSTIPYEFPYHLAIDYDPLKLREKYAELEKHESDHKKSISNEKLRY